ncbi:MAG TPA: AAA family ATPase [Steroidobacteraceae bacterium]|jgi:DNA-binding CsgD family transcriptional regulator/tetratricopeptide (TPR) repeat protein
MSNLPEPVGGRDAHRCIVGRARELEIFRAAFNRMLSGQRQLVLVSGEPGIGKTRCAEALAEVAEDQGSLVLWGRCHEEAGAPPYWPWVQILRAYVEASSIDELRLTMGPAAPDIAALVPELVNIARRPPASNEPVWDAYAARFRMFDAVRQFFHQAAQQVPITLLLDNLHWADQPSLLLLEFLTQELLHSRLLIVATYRDADATGKTALVSTLGGLRRDSEARHIHLTGLSQTAIGELAERLCEGKLPAAALKLIYRRSEGNPLFAIELIRVLMDESAGSEISPLAAKIPSGVREAIGRRLIRLSDRCNELLSMAAVCGRQFSAREIAAMLQLEVHNVLAGLEPAVQAGIVQSNAEVSGGYLFTHALIRETIYKELPAADRLRLHGLAGDALVSVYCANPETALTRIAHHYFESAALDNADKAVMFAMRAADSAVRLCAYEDAVEHYDHVIEMLEERGLMRDERLARGYIHKGSALRQLGQTQQSIAVLLAAVNRTRVVGNVDALVDALMLLAMSSRYVEQQHFVPLLERALALLSESDSLARAKVLATLAFAQRNVTDKAQLQLLVDQSLAIANRSGDAPVRCACYQLAAMALRGAPECLQQRLRLSQENIDIARAAGSADLLADACHWQALNLFESGQIEDLETLLEQYESLSACRFGLHQYQLGAHRAALALLRGEWNGLEARIEALLEVGAAKTRREDAEGVNGAQMFALNRDLGRLHALLPLVKNITTDATARVWEPGLMLICVETGLLTEARDMFERAAVQSFLCVSRDDMYVTCLVFCSETCCTLADAQHAATLYQLLLPYAGQTANHPTAVCFGSADLYLAMLASTAGRPDLARAHFDQALSLNRSMRAWPVVARTLYRYGAFQIDRPSDSERQHGLHLLREAEELARRVEMTRLVIDIDALLHARAVGVSFPDELTAREVEVLRLLAMGRTNKDVSLVLAISLNTVATHVRNILNKTQCANRTEAAAYAMRHGLQNSEPVTVR